MTFDNTGSTARACLALAALLFLASCGGGGGSPGITSGTSGTAQTKATTTLSYSQTAANTYATTLTGAQETPPNSSTAQGLGTISINPDNRTAVATITTNGITGTAAHIHEGAPGVAGPIVFPLSETAPGSGIWTAQITLTEAQLNTLQAGNYYFNVHSAAYPNGEIRGQIPGLQTGASLTTIGSGQNTTVISTSGNAFKADLQGSQETPATNSTAQGSVAAAVNPDTRSMVAALTTTGIAGTGAAIYLAPSGQTGPSIATFTEVMPGSGIWLAKATLSDEQYQALLAGKLYVNVLSAAFPNGEIRGQLLPVQQGAGTTTSSTTANGNNVTSVTSGSNNSTTIIQTPSGTSVSTSSSTGTADEAIAALKTLF